MLNPVNLLLSGPGLIGRKHADLINSDSRWKLIAVVAPNHDENIHFSKKNNIKIYGSVAEAIRCEHIDAAIISSPNTAHVEQALDCLKNKIPVMVEKPLADNLEDAKAVVKASEEFGVHVLVGHHRSYSPLLDAAQRQLASENFGKLVAVQGAALFYKPSQYFLDGPWRSQPGGGPILINLIHEVGFMRILCGNIRKVFAFSSNKQRKFPVEDTVSIALHFESGALGSFLLSDTAASSKSWEMTSGENPAYPFLQNEYCYHFSGTQGSFDFPSMNIRTYDSEASWWLPFSVSAESVERADPLRLQLDHFFDVVQGLCDPKVSAREGYENMRIVQAIIQSILTDLPVEIDDEF